MNITLRLAFGNYAREITGVIVFNIRVSALGKMATAPLTREEINMHVFFPYVREHTNCKWTHTHTLTHTMTIYGFDKRPFYTLLRWRMRERERLTTRITLGIRRTVPNGLEIRLFCKRLCRKSFRGGLRCAGCPAVYRRTAPIVLLGVRQVAGCGLLHPLWTAQTWGITETLCSWWLRIQLGEEL